MESVCRRMYDRKCDEEFVMMSVSVYSRVCDGECVTESVTKSL